MRERRLAMRMNSYVKLFSPGDLRDAIRYLLLLIVSWFLPLRATWVAAKLFATVHSYVCYPSLEGKTWLLEALDRTSCQGTARNFHIETLRFTYHEIILLLRSLRPGKTDLPIELIGREHIDDALSGERGVILLIGKFPYSDFVAKMALGEVGIPISHLSTPNHGSSGTLFGRNIITRVRVTVENRFIRERIVMSPGNSIRPLKILEQRLRENNIVSISAVAGASSVQISCLGGTIELGRAAPALSRKTGAVVLPVFALPTSSFGFAVRVECPLMAVGEGPHFEKGLACAFGARLERIIFDYPTFWLGWEQWKRPNYRYNSSASRG